MTEEFTFTITEMTISTGKKATIVFNLDGKKVRIPIDAEIKAYFNEQFVREKPSALQRKRFSTVMNLLRAAYLQGLSDGQTP
jgi:hypothetical protein